MEISPDHSTKSYPLSIEFCLRHAINCVLHSLPAKFKIGCHQMPTNLLDATISLLKGRPAYIELKKIAEDLNIPISWLSQFNRGLIADPGIKRIQALHDYLIEKEKDRLPL